MGYGLPAAMGVQIAHPDALVIDIAGEASVLMNIQEMGTLAQYRLPVKVFILNNEYMGMVRQWQELLHGGRYSESYSAALPDFVKLADAFHAKGLRAQTRRSARRRDPRDAGLRHRGDRRHRGRSEGELLPDDPVRRRAQRDDPRAGARGAHPVAPPGSPTRGWCWSEPRSPRHGRACPGAVPGLLASHARTAGRMAGDPQARPAMTDGFH